jgi:hypothetical protein
MGINIVFYQGRNVSMQPMPSFPGPAAIENQTQSSFFVFHVERLSLAVNIIPGSPFKNLPPETLVR